MTIQQEFIIIIMAILPISMKMVFVHTTKNLRQYQRAYTMKKKSAITPFDEIPVLKIVLDFFLIALHFVCSSMVSSIISMCLSALLLCVPFVKKKFENSQNKVFIGCFVFVSALMLFFIMFALGDTSLIDVLQFIGDTFWIYLRRIILALLSALITYFICQDTDNKLTYILVFIILCFVLEILVSLAATVL